MERIWTVTLKLSINTELCEGFTVQIKSQKEDWSALENKLHELGLAIGCGGFYTSQFWAWI